MEILERLADVLYFNDRSQQKDDFDIAKKIVAYEGTDCNPSNDNIFAKRC